jgi:transglutaminase-like putative cysteine protease
MKLQRDTVRVVTGPVMTGRAAGQNRVGTCGDSKNRRDRCDHPPVTRNACFHGEIACRDQKQFFEAKGPDFSRNTRGGGHEFGILTASQREFIMFIRTLFALLVLAIPATAAESEKAIQEALAKAGKNRGEIEKALAQSPADMKPGMEFLVANMPDADLGSLKASFLLENLKLAYAARAEMPWGKAIPDDIFFNNVLPYVNVNESRDPWRKELYDLCKPMVKDCKTPAEAAQKLNGTVFEKLKVKYSTERKKADQSPLESMETGKASCTGLSILLSDACRSMCIPTRIVGTPLWSNKRGNHTWVEIWDKRWRFTGACEPDPAGLDHGWFVGDASQAKKDVREHAIYASSFKKTDTVFPLVWAPGRKDVFAENVTDRYAAKAAPKADAARVAVRVWLTGKKERSIVDVTVTDTMDAKASFTGKSRGETNDLNDILSFDLVPGREYVVKIGKTVEKTVTVKAGKELLLEIELPK